MKSYPYFLASMALVIASCSPSAKLKRAERLIRAAVAQGAKVDSFRTQKPDTIRIFEIKKEVEIEKQVDTVRLVEKCRELIKKPSKQKTQAIQKEVCPDTTLNLTDSITVEVQGSKFKVPVIVHVMAKDGHLAASLGVINAEIPFVKEEVKVGISAGYTGWGLLWRILVFGFIPGFAVCFVLKTLRVI